MRRPCCWTAGPCRTTGPGGEDALRRWIAAGVPARPQSEGGTVVVVAEPTLRPVQALVRWGPVGHGARELAERA
ncbi:primosomal protein N' [Streptomyces canarius]